MIENLHSLLNTASPCNHPDLHDISVMTSARFSRNLNGIHFVGFASDQLMENVLELVKNRLTALETTFPVFVPFHSEPTLVRDIIAERLHVGRKFCNFNHPRGVALSEDMCASIVINDSDHLQLRYNVTGLDPEKALEKAEKIEIDFGKLIEYSYDEEFGFLTSSMKLMGTGLRISVIAHLPALVVSGHLDRASAAVTELGFSLKNVFVSSAGHLFRISSRKTLGVSEAEIASEVHKVAQSLISYEKKARESLVSIPRNSFFEDIVARSVGLMKSARLLSLAEALDHLSIVRLGAATNLLPEACSNLLFDCLFDIQPAHLQVKKGREMDEAEQFVERSIIVREHINRVLDNAK